MEHGKLGGLTTVIWAGVGVLKSTPFITATICVGVMLFTASTVTGPPFGVQCTSEGLFGSGRKLVPRIVITTSEFAQDVPQDGADAGEISLVMVGTGFGAPEIANGSG